MFDDVPVRVWLLVAIGVLAFVPTQYIYRHIAHSHSRRDITQPPEDLSWRTEREFIRSTAMLAFLAALGIYIFTPSAERFARSPHFWPLLAAAFGAWTLFSVAQGFVNGRVVPIVKGFSDTYERGTQPKRYWASMTWNATLGILFLWLGYQMNEDASVQSLADRCTEAKDLQFLQQQLSACDQWVSLRPDNPEPYFQRGTLFLEIGALDQAAVDLTRAHELDPADPWPLANRGLVSAWKKDAVKATADFAAVRSLDESNPVMLRGEAVLMRNKGDMRGAVERLTESMKRDPDNLWALRTRSELYWELGEQEKSARDDQRWVQLNKQARIDPN